MARNRRKSNSFMDKLSYLGRTTIGYLGLGLLGGSAISCIPHQPNLPFSGYDNNRPHIVLVGNGDEPEPEPEPGPEEPELEEIEVKVSEEAPKAKPADKPKDTTKPITTKSAEKPAEQPQPKDPVKTTAPKGRNGKQAAVAVERSGNLYWTDGPHQHRPLTMTRFGFHLDPFTEGYDATIVDYGGEGNLGKDMDYDGGTVMPSRMIFGMDAYKERFRLGEDGDKFKIKGINGHLGFDGKRALNGVLTFSNSELKRLHIASTSSSSNGGISTTTDSSDEEQTKEDSIGLQLGIEAGPVRVYVRGRQASNKYDFINTTVVDVDNPPSGSFTNTIVTALEQDNERNIGGLEIGGLLNRYSFVSFYATFDQNKIGDLEQVINGVPQPSSTIGEDYLRFGFGGTIDYIHTDEKGQPILAFGAIVGPQWLDTPDDAIQGFETFKGGGYILYSPRPSSLLYLRGLHLGKDSIEDKGSLEGALGFVIGGGDVANYIQPIAEYISGTNRDRLGINAHNDDGNGALRQKILSNYLTYTLGKDGELDHTWSVLVEGGPVVTREGDNNLGYQAAANFWIPLMEGKASIGGGFAIRDDKMEKRRAGGVIRFRQDLHGFEFGYDQVQDETYGDAKGDARKKHEVFFKYVKSF